ncbi:hypothetical protein D3C85_804920 [compost metagenome]
MTYVDMGIFDRDLSPFNMCVFNSDLTLLEVVVSTNTFANTATQCPSHPKRKRCPVTRVYWVIRKVQTTNLQTIAQTTNVDLWIGTLYWFAVYPIDLKVIAVRTRWSDD